MGEFFHSREGWRGTASILRGRGISIIRGVYFTLLSRVGRDAANGDGDWKKGRSSGNPLMNNLII
jgi:hypothetical protein